MLHICQLSVMARVYELSAYVHIQVQDKDSAREADDLEAHRRVCFQNELVYIQKTTKQYCSGIGWRQTGWGFVQAQDCGFMRQAYTLAPRQRRTAGRQASAWVRSSSSRCGDVTGAASSTEACHQHLRLPISVRTSLVPTCRFSSMVAQCELSCDCNCRRKQSWRRQRLRNISG